MSEPYPLLMVMNPRRIGICLQAIESLVIDKVWFVAMTEKEISVMMPTVLKEARRRGHTHALLLSDDTIPTQIALSAVCSRLQAHPVVTGYCNLDAVLPYVNLTRERFRCLDTSKAEDYVFMTKTEVQEYPSELVPTFFAGACLTGMSLDLWDSYPFRVLGTGNGYGSDWSLSVRLQQDNIPIVAPRDSFIHHVKELWNQRDQAPEKKLLVYEVPAKILWQNEWRIERKPRG